ncbi:WD40 repeat-like protein, partial [Imleria badia]
GAIYSVFFDEDGKQILSGGAGGMLRRWQVDDGHEVGEPIRIEGGSIYAVSMSPDRRWLLLGQHLNVTLWDAQTHKKVLDIRGHTSTVFSVDISPDSTKFATGSGDKRAYIWSMTTGERLIGPLQHKYAVMAVRFSPAGERIATATGENGFIRIFNSENGHQLLSTPCRFIARVSSPLVWSADGRQLFAASYNEVKRIDTSSGSLLSKWSVPGGPRSSIVLSHNQRFAAIAAQGSLSFWDTATEQ